jgi:HTH-type transcriptional regulator, sugar sensing transcriptional regulator
MQEADLTPFGFTATESRVYGVLLKLGPTTGYAVARAARLARANAYGALDGLVTRGAATKSPGRPARYRPSDPQALVARLATLQGEALDRLSRSLEEATRSGEPDTRPLEGARALGNVILQSVARAERRVEGIVTPELLRATLPAWRRAMERATLAVAVSGEPPADAASFAMPSAAPGSPTLLVIDERQVVAATGTDTSLIGVWSSHPAVLAIARLALRAPA